MKTITLAAGATHVPFNDVAHLIAFAIHPEVDDEDDNPSSYHFALIGLETELKNAAKIGQLPVKNKLTLGAHELPIGDALNHVLVTVDDLRAFVADRGIKVAVEATEQQTTELKAKPRISQAPAPITPLNGLSHVQAIPTVALPPKWDKWRHMRDVEIWEAVALSLNLDPDKLPVYLGAYDKLGDDPFRICPSQFLERLLVANSNCGILFGFKHVHDLKARCLVDLPEFVAWALKRNITDMPLELVAMGSSQQSKQSEKPIEQTMCGVVNLALPKQRAQESRVLELLKSQKYDPLKLPLREPGKSGAKAKVRKLALLEIKLFTAKSFDTAWQRLRDDCSIVDDK